MSRRVTPPDAEVRRRAGVIAAARALGLAVGYLADRVLGDPSRTHPVAAFGRLAAAVERHLYADSRARGTVYAAVLTGGSTTAGALMEHGMRHRRVLRIVVTAASTWAVLGGRTLDQEAAAVAHLLEQGRLAAARRRLTHLVGRDTSRLDEGEITRAVVESVAENTSDAVVAALAWGAAGGVAGLVGYRATNTMDAIVGHRTPRLARFGSASARLDDVLNLPGSRLTALLAALAAPCVGGSPAAALRVVRRDAPAHPSPNAGVVEAAFAGALNVQVGGTNVYASGVEERPRLGDGPAPRLADIARARRLARLVQHTAATLTVIAALRPRRTLRSAR